MEAALNLPADMQWASEPLPSLATLTNTNEIIYFEDDFANDLPTEMCDKQNSNTEIVFSDEEFAALFAIQDELQEQMSESDSSVASMAEFNQDQWLDQPINVPLNEYPLILDSPIQPVKGNTVQLLNEFNQIYNTVESIHLTPPQTPPETTHTGYIDDSAENQLTYCPSQPVVDNGTCNYQFTQYNHQPMNQPESDQLQLQQNYSLFEQALNLVQDCSSYTIDPKAIEEVDEFVRSHAEEFDDDSTSNSGSSFSCSSPISEVCSSTNDDSDWHPSKSPAQNQSIGAVGSALKAKQSTKRKPRSNRRSKEDRQIRKKEQNKNAANRYRLKKKAEIEILMDEERDLLKNNESLQNRLSDVNRELKCLKSLLRELFREKGLIK